MALLPRVVLAMALLLAAVLAASPGHAAATRTVRVTDTRSLVAAITGARSGDTILLADGTYNIGSKLRAEADGAPQYPIIVRAEHRWKAVIRSAAVIAFEVTGMSWEFRDLEVRGVCGNDSDCEHAFHVVDANGFRLIGNRLIDFNAALKVNAGAEHAMPEDGLVEGNELFNTHARRTTNTVSPLNIDAAKNWVVRGNLIYDFRKEDGDQVSYGAYVKGGAIAPVFERNLIICARRDQKGGARIGMSFGGGSTGGAFCAPNWDANAPCDPEVTDGIMRNNIVANCSDVGIYLNKSANTLVLFNTLVRTRGIDFRFPSSSGEARGNLLAGRITARDNARFTAEQNMPRQVSGALEDWYRDPDGGDLRLKGDVSALFGKAGADPRVTDDFCGRPRSGALDMGALQSSLGDCATLPQ